MPNKATSKAQFRLFKGVAEGNLRPRGGLTKDKAQEMLGGQSPKGLPERKVKKRKKKRRWSDGLRVKG